MIGSRLLNLILPFALIELFARFCGWVVDMIQPGKGLSLEIRMRAKLYGVRFGYRAKDLGRNITISKPQYLMLGAGTSIRHGTVIMCGPSGVSLGKNTHVSHNSVLAASGGLKIGEECGISSGVIIYTVDYDHSEGLPLSKCPVRHLPVSIGDGVHIGANVTILPGVTIGDHAIIGAGAVVTKDVLANTTVAGVPAKTL